MAVRGDLDQGREEREEDAADVTRRQALGRFGLYTSPVMLALLMSEKAVAATVFL